MKKKKAVQSKKPKMNENHVKRDTVVAKNKKNTVYKSRGASTALNEMMLHESAQN